ncbi:MAG: hypothetical protein ACKO3W_15210 [bacterium]
MRTVADVVFWLSLMLWLALALVGGIAAMAIFPAARELPLSMEGYEAFIAAEPVLGRQLVAGHLVERVFDLAQTPRAILAAIATAALALGIAYAKRDSAPQPLRRLRITALVCAIAALAVSFVAIVGFRVSDRKYRDTAYEVTRDERWLTEARFMKAEVDRAHTFASRVASAEVLSLLALAGLTAAAGVRRRA